MLNIRAIRNRIKSAKNIRQITKAMELVSASKMRKSQAIALAGKFYADKIAQMVKRLGSSQPVTMHPLFRKATAADGKVLIVLISTNKGLCGGLNTNLFRHVQRELQYWKNSEFISIGKKGTHFIVKTGGKMQADFSDTKSFQSLVPALTELIVSQFTSATFDTVVLVYNEFVSPIKQLPKSRVLLPLQVSVAQGAEENTQKDMKIEPNPKKVFEALLPHYLENQIRDAILQAEASEHSARMVAMRNASDNAKSFISDLTLVYNKARQEKITYEIADLVTARLAVEE